MIFNIKHKVTIPEAGETRVLNKFAWFPRMVIDSKRGAKIVWLGRYEILQAYIVHRTTVLIDGEPMAADYGLWVTLEKRLG